MDDDKLQNHYFDCFLQTKNNQNNGFLFTNISFYDLM